jgi:hypothetical protein
MKGDEQQLVGAPPGRIDAAEPVFPGVFSRQGRSSPVCASGSQISRAPAASISSAAA